MLVICEGEMFNGIWLVAEEPLTIQGREIAAGESFHISRVHSGALLVTGKARILRPQLPPKTRALEPETAAPRRRRRAPRKPAGDTQSDSDSTEGVDPGATTDEVIDTPSRRYERRDLEAEE